MAWRPMRKDGCFEFVGSPGTRGGYPLGLTDTPPLTTVVRKLKTPPTQLPARLIVLFTTPMNTYLFYSVSNYEVPSK